MANTLTDLLVFALFFSVFDVNVYFANTIAYAVAVTQSYVFNKSWTFSQPIHLFDVIAYLKFLVVNIVCLFITLTVLFVTRDLLDPYIGKVIAAVIVVIYGFFMNKYFVFRTVEDRYRT